MRVFKDKSFDAIFTNIVLIYIGPDKIAKVMKDMVRLARKDTLFVKYDFFDGDHRWQGVYYHGKWKWNYVEMFKQFVPGCQVRVKDHSRHLAGSEAERGRCGRRVLDRKYLGPRWASQ